MAQILRDKAYVVFLIWQCEGFFVALHRARGEATSARRKSDVLRKAHFVAQQQAFSDFQSALAFAGNIAKFIWPIRDRLRKREVTTAFSRGRRIRKLLQIKRRDEVLFKSPIIRNDFEHLDTRVDIWAEQTKGDPIALHALVPERFLSKIRESDRFTRYDPDTEILSMRNDKATLTNRISFKRLEVSVKRVFVRSALVYRDILDYEARLESQESATPPR